ncbi:hypothetical protein [Nocardia sp. NBC_00511]|uniref:hypothetical protein n=1 Tax=Nocardia sp. NBC_00511 TaxID=2903591 RepID=UPI002F907E3D
MIGKLKQSLGGLVADREALVDLGEYGYLELLAGRVATPVDVQKRTRHHPSPASSYVLNRDVVNDDLADAATVRGNLQPIDSVRASQGSTFDRWGI